MCHCNENESQCNDSVNEVIAGIEHKVKLVWLKKDINVRKEKIRCVGGWCGRCKLCVQVHDGDVAYF